MRHGSLFSGIGGFDLAAEWMGWENVFHCEWNQFGQKVLNHYWPKAISYHDITKTDFTIHRGTIDIITGGFPCQPYSMAGKRKGKDDERHLWPEMLRAIREVQPRWVVGENVLGLVNWNGGLVFHEVQTDLEAEGYEVFPYVLPAVSVNAPHRRDRVWFVAYRNATNTDGIRLEQCKNRTEMGRGQKEMVSQRNKLTNAIKTNGKVSDTPQTNGNGLNWSDCQHEVNASEGGKYAQRDLEQGIGYGYAADTDSQRHEKRITTTEPSESKRKYSQTDIGAGFRSWQNFPTQSPVCTRDDGLSTRLDGITFPKWRNESIKAAGNAIVPQVVFQIFKAIDHYERSHG